MKKKYLNKFILRMQNLKSFILFKISIIFCFNSISRISLTEKIEQNISLKHLLKSVSGIYLRYRKQSFIYASNEPLFYNKCVETLMCFVQKGL
ncbi:hypothetical protein BpHYR1_015997 [Brachionus plicatilis]|uniref:Uncharacterized protein n=1 Tax=Brachionus plicatilis TaxID=10195 RepID=A0A3M7P8L2_BRAPC|nr:hypothetical protein BpHYR1_015997 [Brachionus plicatilis]